MSAQSNAPIIIKRKKVIAGGGHHGGAWKVAYADFVTAMMAFFLLMWLLGATTEEQRRGIADYFNPSVALKRTSGGGDGAFGGDSVMSESSLTKTGVGASSSFHAEHDTGDSAISLEEGGFNASVDGQLDEVREQLQARGGESFIADDLKQHMLLRVTDEGLVVELFDLPGRRLISEQDEPQPVLLELVRAIGIAFGYSSNQVAIKSFVRSVPVVLASPRRFETSIAHAEMVRNLMSAHLDPMRIDRVSGYGDRQPATPDRTDIRNNRFELVLLR